jgi:hypothetical protein
MIIYIKGKGLKRKSVLDTAIQQSGRRVLYSNNIRTLLNKCRGEGVRADRSRPILNLGTGLDLYTREPVRTTSHRIKILRLHDENKVITSMAVDLPTDGHNHPIESVFTI